MKRVAGKGGRFIWGVGLVRLDADTLGLNPIQDMDVFIRPIDVKVLLITRPRSPPCVKGSRSSKEYRATDNNYNVS